MPLEAVGEQLERAIQIAVPAVCIGEGHERAPVGVALGPEQRAKSLDLPFQGFGHGGSRRIQRDRGAS
jgi:hypothetical protein